MNENSNLFLVPLLLLLSIQLSGQIYFSTDKGMLGTINLNDCTVRYLDGPSGRLNFIAGPLPDLALHPDGRLFGLDVDSQGAILIEFDMKNPGIKENKTFSLDISSRSATSLVADTNDIFYITGLNNRVYPFDLKNEVRLDRIGNFRHMVPGDIVIKDDKLLATFMDVSRDRVGIQQIDLEDPTIREEVLTYDTTIGPIGGLTLIWNNETNQKELLGADLMDSPGVYRINIEEQSVEELCRLETNDVKIWGLTGSDEFRQNFDLQLDLDQDNSSGRLIDHYELDTLCLTHFPLADKDIAIISPDSQVDSMVITVVKGVQLKEDEVLVYEGPSIASLDLGGMNTQRLVFANNGNASLEDYKRALSETRLAILSRQLINGERIVETRLYRNGIPSDPAKTFIPTEFFTIPYAGRDTTLERCFNRGVDVVALLGPGIRSTGRWEPELHQDNGIINPAIDTSLVFRYIVEEGNCPADTGQINFIPRPDPMIGIRGERFAVVELCEGDTLVWDATVDRAISYRWSNGNTTAVNEFAAPGDYSVVIEDDLGCIYGATTRIRRRPGQAIQSTSIVTHCQASPYEWNNQLLSVDTLVCETFRRLETCDSTACVDLKVIPPVIATSQVNLCEGEQFNFNGQVLDQAGRYTDTLQTIEGCDSLSVLELQFFPKYEVSRDTQLCPGNSILLEGQVISEAGQYPFMQMSTQGCDSLITWEVSVIPDEGIITQSVTGCEGNPVSLNGQDYFSNTTVCDTFQNRLGCDSIVCTAIQFLVQSIGNRTIDLCQGQSITINNETYFNDRLIIDTLLAPNGCDSLSLIELNFFPRYRIMFDTIISAGQNLQIGTVVLDRTGQYEIDLMSQNGCDSTIVLTLNIDSTTVGIQAIAYSKQYYAPSILWQGQAEGFTIFHRNNTPAARIETLMIYNALGQLVYQGKGGWTGDWSNAWSVQGAHKGWYIFRVALNGTDQAIEYFSGRFLVQ